MSDFQGCLLPPPSNGRGRWLQQHRRAVQRVQKASGAGCKVRRQSLGIQAGSTTTGARKGGGWATGIPLEDSLSYNKAAAPAPASLL